jgi:hypothetical protein
VDDGLPTTWVNQGSATVDTSKGGAYLLAPAAAGDNLRVRDKAAPTAPYTIVVPLVPHLHAVNYNQVGLVFREAASGKLVTLTLVSSGGFTHTQVIHWNGPTSWSSFPFSVAIHPGVPVFLRIQDDTTNRSYAWSNDGVHWHQVGSESRTAFLTADRVGIYASSSHASSAAAAWFLGWDEQ